jgi:hypothetical protein
MTDFQPDESVRHDRFLVDVNRAGTKHRWLCGCGSYGRWIWRGQSAQACRIGWEKHVAGYAARVCENNL